MTYNREISKLGSYIGVNTSTDTISFDSVVVASSGFVGSATTQTPPVTIDIIGNTIRFSVAGIGSATLNLV